MFGLGWLWGYEPRTQEESVYHTLKTEASKRSLPDARLSRLRVRKRPRGERKSGMPAWTEIPAPGRRISVRMLAENTGCKPQTTTMRLALRMVWMSFWSWAGGFEERARKGGVRGLGEGEWRGRKRVMIVETKRLDQNRIWYNTYVFFPQSPHITSINWHTTMFPDQLFMMMPRQTY